MTFKFHSGLNSRVEIFKSAYIGLFVLLFALSVFTGCATTNETHSKSEDQQVAKKNEVKKQDTLPVAEQIEDDEELLLSTHPQKTSQEILDSALEFCQASNDYWERGDLENAIDALDQAYSLILTIDSYEGSPEILQQKEDLRFTISKRIAEVYASRFTVANGDYKAIPLDMNKNVEKALKLFQGRERKFFLDSYRRSGKYRPKIVKALKEAGLPEELSWLPLIESGFKIRAFSRARALGMWQFIASTGYKFGLKRDRWVDERMDPDKATRAAIAYMKELHKIFGDWTTVLAAYNCGEGRVLKKIRTQRINYLDNFWDLYPKLPSETAFYVPKFLAVLHIINNPEAHGFTLPPLDEVIEFEKVSIDKQVHLKSIAKHMEIPYEIIKELNPELRQNCTPTRPYNIKTPKDTKEILLAKINGIPTWHPPVPAFVLHRVRRGESLSTIAKRYRTSIRAIMAFNNLKRKNFVKAGWRLKIPTKKTYKRHAAVSGKTILATGKSPEKYIVRKGDSLWKIAGRFKTTTKAIQSMNNLRHSRLRIGQVLKIPNVSHAFENMKTTTYKVLKGDSAHLIAQKHQMGLSEFLRLNYLTPRTTIYPGQSLLVKVD